MLCSTTFLPLIEEAIISIETTNAAIRLFPREPVSKARKKNSYTASDWLHRFFFKCEKNAAINNICSSL